MNIVLLGSPASGKGTQADYLCKEFGLYYLATGDLTRKLAETDPEIKRMYDKGELIPQELITMHVINFLNKNKSDLKDILFEGFPRFISQYEALDSFLKNTGDDIDAIISLDVSEEVAVKRISSRRVCEKCGEVYNLVTKPTKIPGICDKCGGETIQRKDDNSESVKVRFQYYKDNTKELVDYVEKLGKLTRVNGDRSVDEISKDLKEIVSKIKNERD